MNNSVMKTLLPLAGVLVAVGLGACGGKASVREPAELKDIDKPGLRLEKAWTARAGDGSDGRVSGLRLSLEDDALYTANIDGRVFAYERESGKVLWHVDTGARVISGPTVSGNAIYLGTLDAELIALKRADGSELWRQQMSSEVLGAPASAGPVVVTRTVDGRIYGLSSSAGDRLWSFDRVVPSLVLRGNSKPLVVGGKGLHRHGQWTRGQPERGRRPALVGTGHRSAQRTHRAGTPDRRRRRIAGCAAVRGRGKFWRRSGLSRSRQWRGHVAPFDPQLQRHGSF